MNAGSENWLRTLPNGPGREVAVSVYVGSVARDNPAMAVEWLGSISDNDHRRTQMEVVARNWLEEDPTSARVWLDRSSLPEETKKRLLTSAGK